MQLYTRQVVGSVPTRGVLTLLNLNTQPIAYPAICGIQREAIQNNKTYITSNIHEEKTNSEVIITNIFFCKIYVCINTMTTIDSFYKNVIVFH